MMTRYLILVSITLLLLTACGLGATSHAVPTTHLPSDAEHNSTPSGDTETLKATVPLDVDLTVESQTLVVGGEGQLTIHVRPHGDAHRIISHLEASGAITVNPSDHVWA